MDDSQITDTHTATPTLEPWQEANALASDVIKEIAGEFAADDDAPPPDVSASDSSDSADATPVAADPGEGEQAAAGSDGDVSSSAEPSVERGMARLVEREVDIRRREDAIAAREAHLSQLETKVRELESKASQYQGDFHEHLRNRPTEALTAAGHDPDHIVRVYLAEKLQREGKPVPAELKSAIERSEQSFETSRLRRELQDYQRQQAAQQFVAAIEAGARTYLTTSEISKHAPTVASVAAKAPDRVFREIMDEIARDAQGKAGKDPNAPVLTYEEAAKRVEARWVEFRSFLGLPAASSDPATKKPESPVASKGASVPSAKPVKPLTTKPPANQAELEKAAIDAGIAEFKRVEAAKRAP